MTSFLLSFSANIGAILLLISILGVMKKVSLVPKWGIISFILLLGYFAAIFLGRHIIPLDNLFPNLNFNWAGKIAAIVLWVTVLAVFVHFKQHFKLADAGFTLKQNAGSTKPALIAVILFLTLHITLSLILGETSHFTAESLVYQAIIPGLDEEPMFRGLILYAMSLAIVSGRINILNANLNIAGVLLTVLFGLVHGVIYNEGLWHFSIQSIVLTGSYGFVLLWLRERTGSLVIPILAHNLVNFSSQFI